MADEINRLAETENSDLAAAKEDEESRHLLDDLTAKEKELIRANVEASRSIIKAAREAAKVHKELDEGRWQFSDRYTSESVIAFSNTFSFIYVFYTVCTIHVYTHVLMQLTVFPQR